MPLKNMPNLGHSVNIFFQQKNCNLDTKKDRLDLLNLFQLKDSQCIEMSTTQGPIGIPISQPYSYRFVFKIR